MTAAGTPAGKAWSGRFAEGADPTAEAFTSSLAFVVSISSWQCGQCTKKL